MDIFVVDTDKRARDALLGHLLEAKSRSYLNDSFYVIDIDRLVAKVTEWRRCMPRVQLFYAVKSNSSPPILRALAALGCGFDVAGETEMEKVLNLKVPPNLLVYSNPCKIVQDLLYARKNNISLTVFDSEDELLKIKKFFPDSKLLIRIRHDDERSALVIGRFGVLRNQVRSLIDKCWELELQIVGVAFHVGHGSSGPGAYVAAIEEAKTFFDYAQEHGKPFHVLDIGGGFPGSFGASTVPLVEYGFPISIALDKHFPEESKIQVIGEPGQFIVAITQILLASVIGKKTATEHGSQRAYILSDGYHGSCRHIAMYKFKLEIIVFGSDFQQLDLSQHKCFPSTLYGPTGAPMDCIATDVMLPELQTGQWLEFGRMGAYTNELFCNFNGVRSPKIVTFVSEDNRSLLGNLSEADMFHISPPRPVSFG